MIEYRKLNINLISTVLKHDYPSIKDLIKELNDKSYPIYGIGVALQHLTENKDKQMIKYLIDNYHSYITNRDVLYSLDSCLQHQNSNLFEYLRQKISLTDEGERSTSLISLALNYCQYHVIQYYINDYYDHQRYDQIIEVIDETLKNKNTWSLEFIVKLLTSKNDVPEIIKTKLDQSIKFLADHEGLCPCGCNLKSWGDYDD